MSNQELAEWLSSEPSPDEIRIKDGAKYIPYHIICSKLDKLDKNWGTRNFSHLFYTLRNGKTICSGNVEVVLSDNRVLSGAATVVLTKMSNPHPAATVKSLSVMNAVKTLGRQFGWGLNGFENESVYFPDEDVPVVQNKKKERLEALIDDCKSVEELAKYKANLDTEELNKKYISKLKELTNKLKQ